MHVERDVTSRNTAFTYVHNGTYKYVQTLRQLGATQMLLTGAEDEAETNLLRAVRLGSSEVDQAKVQAVRVFLHHQRAHSHLACVFKVLGVFFYAAHTEGDDLQSIREGLLT